MQTNQTSTVSTPQAFTDRNTVIVLYEGLGIKEQPLLNDENTGRIYYMEGNCRRYLADQFQPRLVI